MMGLACNLYKLLLLLLLLVTITALCRIIPNRLIRIYQIFRGSRTLTLWLFGTAK